MNVDTAGATMSLEDATIRCEGLDNLEIKHRLNHISGNLVPYLDLEVGTGNIEITGIEHDTMVAIVAAFQQAGEGE